MEPYLVFELSLKVLAFEKYAKMRKKTFRIGRTKFKPTFKKPLIVFRVSKLGWRLF
jgi:hypothetical protein